jgi:hypothetical protein
MVRVVTKKIISVLLLLPRKAKIEKDAIKKKYGQFFASWHFFDCPN